MDEELKNLACNLLNEDSLLALKKPGCDVSKYPYVWLRDNCLCDSCFNSVTCSRKTRLEGLNLDVKVKTAVVKVVSNNLLLPWFTFTRALL